MVNDLFKSLDIDKSECLEDIKNGDSSSASFMACVESISEEIVHQLHLWLGRGVY